VSIENQGSSRQFRIDEILSLQGEPAVEVWRKFEVGGDDVSAAEELGYPIEYFRNLFAQEFISRLSSGESFTAFPKLTSELDIVCWNTVSAKVKLGLPVIVESPLCIQFRLKLLSLHRNGVPIRDIGKKFNLDKVEIRALLMLALAEDGLTLNEIGDEFKLTRERARQIIAKLGISVRSLRQQQSNEAEQEELNLIASIESWLTEHPGCRLSEIASAFNVTEIAIQRLGLRNLQRLVLRSSPKINTNNSKVFSREQILEALRKAYELRNPSMSMYSVSETIPLTGPFYEEMRNAGSVYGPHRMRVLQIFGTWKSACEEAGVPSVEAVRDTYERRWTEEQLIEQLAEFISVSESSSRNDFDEWCRLDDSRASVGTIQNQVGPWFDVYESALLLLRQRWTNN